MLTIADDHGFSQDELIKVSQGFDMANRVLPSKDFHQRILAHHKLDGTPGFENTDDTPEQVYTRLTTGDAAIRISIQSYPWYDFPKRNEVAHENPDGGVVLNRKFFANEDVPSLVNTIIHEYCHTRGYVHDHEPTARRPYSVPYGVGDIAHTVATQLMAAAG
jgi:hypothetical protein